MRIARRLDGSSRHANAPSTASAVSAAAGPSPVSGAVVQRIDPVVATSAAASSALRACRSTAGRVHRERDDDARHHREQARASRVCARRGGRTAYTSGRCSGPCAENTCAERQRAVAHRERGRRVHAFVDDELARREVRGQPDHRRAEREQRHVDASAHESHRPRHRRHVTTAPCSAGTRRRLSASEAASDLAVNPAPNGELRARPRTRP